MAIWRVTTGKVICDTCGTLLAHIEFDANDQIDLERVHVLCEGCHEAKMAKNQEATKILKVSNPIPLNYPLNYIQAVTSEERGDHVSV